MEEYYPRNVRKDKLEIILEQMNNSICKIIKKERNYEIGFFINIKYKNKKIPVLMTKYNIIGIDKDKILNVIINNKTKIIKLGDARYQNKEYDLTLVEIKLNEKDNIKFIEIDDNIFNKELENDYYKKPIYIIQDNKKDISVSFGIIEGIIKNYIKYSCYINYDTKIIPVFNIENNKIIGIHLNKSNNNKGILIKNIIKDFMKIFKNGIKRKKNEINLLINIDKPEINKEIYFMDNYDNYHNNLKELNDLNTELYINNIKYKYSKYFIPKNEGKYNIKLKFNINIKECSYIFANCKNIEDINLSDFNTENVINMKYMFYGCNIKKINLFSFNTKNVKNMNNIFENCKNLKYLDISFFDINNVSNMSEMFKGCSSLISFPDISKWDMKNMNNISEMFKGCSSLKSLPDISKWNLKNINDLSSLFEGCSSLISLPDISKWDISNLYDYRRMFKGCSALKTFPDISKFINKNVFNLTVIGEYHSLPEINLKKDVKILLCGGISGVGCDSLAGISIGEEFNDNNQAILASQFREIKFFLNHKEIKVTLWNVPGQEAYRALLKLFLKDTDIIIFVYDVTCQTSFKELDYLIKMAEDNLGNNFIGAIVANKSDLFLMKQVDEEQGEKLAKEKNYKFYLVSAKDNQQAFINCLDDLVKDCILTVHPELLTKTKNDKKNKKSK